MIVASLVITAMSVHPSLLSYLLVVANTGTLIIMREIARAEGASHPICVKCLISGFVISGIALFFMLKVNWLAI